MKKLSLVASLITATCVSGHSWAKQEPRALATDTRMKIVSFQKSNVVQVVASPLVMTTIHFGKGERILGVYLGDTSAWVFSWNKARPNILFLKPQALSSDTDMTVLTNMDTYTFHILTNPKISASSPDTTFSIQFKYPEREEAAMEAKNKEKDRLNKLFVSHATPPSEWNKNYTYYGDKFLAPIEAYDDSRFTYFRLQPHSPVPAVFAVDKKGNESLVNTRIQGGYLVVETLGRQFTFRYGDETTCIFNKGFPA